ncbi:MAG TPA: transglutaminase-like cysteine peptidase [Novosphingobium sp.]|nr:transglutaminase-like cysteine peptidase [Novosphingobium sp.]
MASRLSIRRRALGALALCAVPATAQANVGLGALPLALSAAAALEQGRCAAPTMPAYGTLRTETPISTSKASAILGGQVSALEAMRLQQAGAAPVQLAVAELPGNGVVPRSGGECSMFIVPRAELAALRPGRGTDAFGSDDFLASKRLPVRKTSFDAQWSRVRRETLSSSVAGLGRVSGEPLLASVNAWANHRIRYVEDRQLYGKADYWAGARTTLRRGAGDCEDIAIAKMALLAAMGVPREAMFLTIARDLARNADHALLVVKLDGRHWLLDNATDRLLDGNAANEYRPILSYSADKKWLHGY